MGPGGWLHQACCTASAVAVNACIHGSFSRPCAVWLGGVWRFRSTCYQWIHLFLLASCYCYSEHLGCVVTCSSHSIQFKCLLRIGCAPALMLVRIFSLILHISEVLLLCRGGLAATAGRHGER
jgi:hypothetical protein